MSNQLTDHLVDVHLDALPFATHSLMHIIAKMGSSYGALVHLHSVVQVIAGDGRDVTDQLGLRNKGIMLNAKYITLILDAPTY